MAFIEGWLYLRGFSFHTLIAFIDIMKLQYMYIHCTKMDKVLCRMKEVFKCGLPSRVEAFTMKVDELVHG